jgi:hypothetical protein
MSVITEGAHDTQGDHVTATQQVETGRQKFAVTAQADTHINLRRPGSYHNHRCVPNTHKLV